MGTKLGEKAVARSNCSQNRNILFKCPRWSKQHHPTIRECCPIHSLAPPNDTEVRGIMKYSHDAALAAKWSLQSFVEILKSL